TVGVAAGCGAEIQMVATDHQRNRAIRNHERAAHRIAHHLHAAARHATARSRPSQTFLDTAPQAECRSPDEQQEHRVEDNFKHQAPGLPPGCADRRLSSARFAACASGLSGASCTTFCQASSAPARSCLPNALTTPTFSSVLACFGSSCSECENCSSAL